MRTQIVQGMDVVGGEMEQMSKQLVPVDTGFLRDSIFHQLVESDLNLTLGATADYTAYVEFGTRHSRAQPFIRPSFDAHSQKLLDALLHGVMDAFQ